jgi:hypothetical protein
VVLRLITNSNLVGSIAGRSPGFSPLSLSEVYLPAQAPRPENTAYREAGGASDEFLDHTGGAFGNDESWIIAGDAARNRDRAAEGAACEVGELRRAPAPARSITSSARC